METIRTFFGKSNYWWAVLALGVLVAILGFWMLFQPLEGYELIARMFGWALLITGVVEVVVSMSLEKKLQGWGWWLAGGIIDIFIGIILIANITLAYQVIPYFFAFIFLFKGIQNIIASFVIMQGNRIWWLYLLNGVLMVILSWMFFTSADNPSFIVDFLVALVFIYWGSMMAVFSFDLKPIKSKND
ncbi:MAG: DUF308 domain-containing protein [Bacteroidales bacterium]